MPVFTEEDPTYDDITETNSLASGSVNEILDGIADVQEFRESVILLDHLDDLTIPDHIFDQSSSTEEVSTIKRKPFDAKSLLIGQNFKNFAKTSGNSQSENTEDTNMNLTESDFLNNALSSGGGRLSRSNSSNQLCRSSSDHGKVR